MNRFTVFSLALMTALLASCTSTKTGKTNYSTNYDPPCYRPTNPSAMRVKISTGAQKLYVMEGDRCLLASPCTVGKPGSPTPAGNHTIYTKTFKRRSMSYGNYPLPYWCEFKPGYGIHWGYIKPYPNTHGCVRLPRWVAAKFFALVPTGTRLNVSSSQPEDATIGQKLPTFDETYMPDPPMSYLLSDQVFQDIVYKGKVFAD